MVFSSVAFLIYFLPVLLIVYYAAGRKYKNIILLLFSIAFYSWGAPKFIFVILGTTLIDFHLVRWMDRADSLLKRRLLLSLSISINLGLLIYFKYSNFFIENLNGLFEILGTGEIHWVKLILPIGISFYTFETITYVVDVYRKIHRPLNHFWDYQLYIILFPKLIAGPIVRYHEISDQITDRSEYETNENRLTGFYRFVIGLSKKTLIANTMGEIADQVFSSNYTTLSSATAWTGILAYTFQIYFDFSGYSDMALGLGKMLGFRFPENFNNPYTSQSITEFWRRWHMTLGSWMRNYLYIPLGGNKVKTKGRLYLNLWIVFLASGLWHGAAWSFVFWGAYHGMFLVLEKAFLLKLYERMWKPIRILLTFFIVVVGWIFFRVENFQNAFLYLCRMLSFNSASLPYLEPKFITVFILATIFSFFTSFPAGQNIQNSIYQNPYTANKHILMAISGCVLFILSLGAITTSGFNPFIYFRF